MLIYSNKSVFLTMYLLANEIEYLKVPRGISVRFYSVVLGGGVGEGQLNCQVKQLNS